MILPQKAIGENQLASREALMKPTDGDDLPLSGVIVGRLARHHRAARLLRGIVSMKKELFIGMS